MSKNWLWGIIAGPLVVALLSILGALYVQERNERRALRQALAGHETRLQLLEATAENHTKALLLIAGKLFWTPAIPH